MKYKYNTCPVSLYVNHIKKKYHNRNINTYVGYTTHINGLEINKFQNSNLSNKKINKLKNCVKTKHEFYRICIMNKHDSYDTTKSNLSQWGNWINYNKN